MDEAADRGNAEALNGLGFLFFNGDVVPRNYTKALAYFTRSAALGSTDGMVNAGVMSLHGHGMEGGADHAAAHRWFLEGAKSGHFGCIYHAAELEAKGSAAVSRSCPRAFTFFAAVAAVGPWGLVLPAGLKHFLGGRGAAAERAYARAAELGYATGRYNLQWMYSKALQDARVFQSEAFAKELQVGFRV